MLHFKDMNIFSFISRNWQHLYTVFFFAGFIVDSLILPDVTNPMTKYIGLAYLMILASAIILREWLVARNRASNFEQKLYALLSFGVLFFSGASLSFIFIYSLRSAAFAVSWPLFLILFACIVANEIVDTHKYRFTLDIAVFFVALVFYLVFNIPIVFNTVNDLVFLVAVAIAVAVGFAFITILRKTSEIAEYERGRGYALALGIPLFVGMLYFLNLIPAVPLTLRDSGVYHIVTRTPSGIYIGQKEVDERFLAKFRRQVFHMTEYDTGVYFFSSVGAPADVSAPLRHVWEYYDPATDKWVTSTTVSFEVSGGRAEGYRAYSKKENVTPGLWRVTVKVDNNRIIGRMRFYIEEGENVELKEIRL
jgi:uncharacterized membrane protein YgdD (TMEM256/DUF423 family)